MKNLLAFATLSLLSTTAFADDTQPQPADEPTAEPTPVCCETVERPVVRKQRQEPKDLDTSTAASATDAETGWHRPVGERFSHGFRMGWTYIKNYDEATRDGGMDGAKRSLKEEFKLKTPHMMLLGYEGFYRVIGHSWLNVVMVGNVTVAGLEQSKFIPAASGLIGFEFDHSFQVGVGVNLTPDPQSPSHMIAACGWTPSVGSIQTPIHFFYVPDADGNSRMGATVGMNW